MFGFENLLWFSNYESLSWSIVMSFFIAGINDSFETL